MAIRIPKNFNIATQSLDSKETFIRDSLGLNIANWAKFRLAINIGTKANVLKSINGSSISRDVKLSYIELGKSHYEVITSLGCAKISLNELLNDSSRGITFNKNIKDFYFHAGRMIDNFARLVYIINDRMSPSAAGKKWFNNKKIQILERHWIDWGSLKNIYPKYRGFKSNKKIKEIINIRNTVTHSWSFPMRSVTGYDLKWPRAIRNSRDLFWPYDELGNMDRYYRNWNVIIDDMISDFNILEKFQNDLFARLKTDIKIFENNNNIKII